VHSMRTPGVAQEWNMFVKKEIMSAFWLTLQNAILIVICTCQPDNWSRYAFRKVGIMSLTPCDRDR